MRAFPLLPVLVAIFAAAKVFGFSSMSWWWVFSPILIPLALAPVLVLTVGIFAGIAGTVVAVVKALDKKE